MPIKNEGKEIIATTKTEGGALGVIRTKLIYCCGTQLILTRPKGSSKYKGGFQQGEACIMYSGKALEPK